MADKNDSPHNCQSCKRTDSAESEMVECEVCQRWEHFGCAGVGEEIRQQDARYICRRCSQQGKPNKDDRLKVPAAEPQTSKGSKANSRVSSRRTKKNPDPPANVTSSMRAALLAEQLKLVKEQHKLDEQTLLEEGEIKKRLLEEELDLKRKQQQLRKESLEKRQSDKWRKLAMRAAGRSDGGRSVQANDLCANQISGDPAEQPTSPLPFLPRNSEPQNFPVHPLPPVQNTNGSRLHEFPPRFPSGTVPVIGSHSSRPAQVPQPAPTAPIFSGATLLQAQIAARQVLGKDLPVFSGSPEEWPIFISNFEQSTATCGY
ncbi:mitogen-activated protein kinase 7-like [Sabethes cyaneus]|uniref:mitogen-activated protein kinase 7-like n=1 Tax=Sabethes cyaneus TaxID=53552 RepID=UPI00237D5156|nr:mitogen-activated protein kinase 7-like [Sabethes cyaneus]